jgi:hypothetical protein
MEVSNTVIAIFDNGSKANNAIQQLVNCGFDRGFIDYNFHTDSSSDWQVRPSTHRLFSFFRTLFPHEEAVRYYHTAMESGYIISVAVASMMEGLRVARLLDACGSVPFETREGQTKTLISPIVVPEPLRLREERVSVISDQEQVALKDLESVIRE